MSITLAQYIQQNPMADLQDVHDYTELSTSMLSSKTMGLILSELNLYLIVDEIAKGKHDTEILDEGVGTGEFTNHAAKEACLLIVNTLNDGSSDGGDFNFIIGDGTSTGDKIIARTEHMRDVTMSEYSVQIDMLLTECKARCNKTTSPFVNVTQSQLDEVKAILAIQKQECIYPNNLTYIQTASNQGVDVEINTDIDCSFTVYLLVCSEKQDPEDTLNFTPVNGDRPVTYPVSSVNNRLLIELSSKKMRHYNKLYVKPDAVCTFTAMASVNRG
jgi:hypothetical protein